MPNCTTLGQSELLLWLFKFSCWTLTFQGGLSFRGSSKEWMIFFNCLAPPPSTFYLFIYLFYWTWMQWMNYECVEFLSNSSAECEWWALISSVCSLQLLSLSSDIKSQIEGWKNNLLISQSVTTVCYNEDLPPSPPPPLPCLPSEIGSDELEPFVYCKPWEQWRCSVFR